jgi:predicted membrane protein
MESPKGPVFTPRLVAGLFIAAAGALLAADRFGLIDARPFWEYWPLLLIGIGLAKLFQPGSRGGAIVLLALGTYFLLRTLDLIDVDLGDLAPFILLIVGLVLVVTALSRRHPSAAGQADSSSLVHAFAMLGGSNPVSNSAQFRGGTATAIAGACEIDLRQAAITGGEAVIDTFAFWGGIEILVPESWSVVLRGVPVLGSFEDKTMPPAGGSTQRLVVKGLAIMGGVEVKNARDRR